MSSSISGIAPMASTPDLTRVQPPRSGRLSHIGLLALALVMALGAGLRWVDFPHLKELRDVDEVGYISSGLVMWEGMTPGYRASPAAPQTWLAWLYAAEKSARATLHPTAELRQAPAQIRPYLAIDDTLFDIYQDMSGIHRFLLMTEFLIALAGIYAAFRLGAYYGGDWGGIFLGGLVALLPLYLEFSAMTRPYSDAWAFSFLTLYSAAVHRGTRRWIQTGIFLALAVSSRIDMLAVLPVVLWQFWDNPEPSITWRSIIKTLVLAMTLTLLLVPWLFTSLIGILRMIVTIRVAGQFTADNPRLTTLKEVIWTQGLALIVAIIAIGLPLTPKERRFRYALLAAYVALLVASMFTGPYQPLRYHGAPLITLITLSAIAAAIALRRWATFAPIITAVLLVLPAYQAFRFIRLQKSVWAPDDATAWIEQHVPAGTRVYDQINRDIRSPLPTPEAADAIWAEVTDAQSWRRKFERGLTRFHLAADHTPRAFSEDNLVLDRNDWRRMFILGSHPDSPRPRYDVQLFKSSPTYGVQDVTATYLKEGGVIIWREGPPPPELGKPTIQWPAPADVGTLIFCSPDVMSKLTK